MRYTTVAIPAVLALSVLGAPAPGPSSEIHQLAERDRWWSPLFSCFRGSSTNEDDCSTEVEDAPSRSSSGSAKLPSKLPKSGVISGSGMDQIGQDGRSSGTFDADRLDNYKPKYKEPAQPQDGGSRKSMHFDDAGSLDGSGNFDEAFDAFADLDQSLADDPFLPFQGLFTFSERALQAEWVYEAGVWARGGKVEEIPRYDIKLEHDEDETPAQREEVEQFEAYLDFMTVKYEFLKSQQRNRVFRLSSAEKDVLDHGNTGPRPELGLPYDGPLVDAIGDWIYRGRRIAAGTSGVPQTPVSFREVMQATDLQFFYLRRGLANIRSSLLKSLTNAMPKTAKAPSRSRTGTSRNI